MVYLLDTSALLAHYLAENGCERVQSIFADDSALTAVSIVTLFEFEFRLFKLGLDSDERTEQLSRYRSLLNSVVDVNDSVRAEAIHLRLNATAHISAIDVIIAASASQSDAILVHRDPHFAAIPIAFLRQETLPLK